LRSIEICGAGMTLGDAERGTVVVPMYLMGR